MELDLVLKILFLCSPCLTTCSFDSLSHYFTGTYKKKIKYWKFREAETCRFIIAKEKKKIKFPFPSQFSSQSLPKCNNNKKKWKE